MVYRRRREDEEDDDDFFGDMFDSFGIDFDRFNERMRLYLLWKIPLFH